jgi:scyllo-inositol 2-dehydrogenase (NADP+)
LTVTRCGVVGFGLAGRVFHTAVIDAVPGLDLAAIVERRGDQAAQAYPGVRIFRSLDALLADGDVDLVVVATPNATHFPFARQSLQAGKHVVIDKPFTVTSGEAAELIELAGGQRRLLAVYQNRRWDGDFLTVRRLLAAGELGELASFISRFDRFRPQRTPDAWREQGPGAGLLFDLGPHLIDQAQVLFGKPEAIFADVRSERPGGEADDAFDIRLYYPNVAVTLHCTCLAAMPMTRFEVRGSRATYRKLGLDPQEDRLRAGDLFQTEPWGLEPESEWGTLTESGADGQAVNKRVPTEAGDYRGFYANVRDALAGRAALAVSPVEAWRTMRLIEWARTSSDERRVVRCQWTGEPTYAFGS